ncbi:hypothetical protein PG996_006553 [Apiospora saccharicola]|uniref:NAD(P)-binding protein n=1 Tax=Apiospora saccharicola TaxID=335842 RepID=A0ABR1V8D1_9PEZI
MAPKIVVVTGANFGIGFEAVKAFLQSPNSYHVYLGSRSVEKGTQAIEQLRAQCPQTKNTVELLQVDLGSDASIEKAFEKVKNGPGHVDVLINNAGAGFDHDFLQGKMSLRDCFNQAYDVNVAGTNVMIWNFIPLLLKSTTTPRILFLAGLSQMTAAAEGPYFPTPPLAAGWPKKDISFETIGYRCSKTALSMLMLDWNHKLQADGVKVFSVSPGFCATGLGGLPEEMTKAMGAVHPSEGGQRLIAVAEGKRDADAGKILDKEGFIPW